MNNTLSKYFSDLYNGNKKLDFEEIYQLLKENKKEIRLLNLADFLSYISNIDYNNLDVDILSSSYIDISEELVFKIIKYCVENGVDLSLKSGEGVTPLAYAILLDISITMGLDTECRLSKLLIENGADVNQKIDIKLRNRKTTKISPLIFAAYYNLNATKVLLEHGAKLENDYDVFYASSDKSYDVSSDRSYARLYNDDRGFLQVAIDLQAHDLIELVVKKHIEEDIPFAKGYCLNPLFDLRKEDEIGNQLIETREESKVAVNKIIKTLELFKKSGVKIADYFYHFVSNSAEKPIKTDYDSTIKDAIDLREKLYLFDRGESTLTLLKHLINLGAKIHDEDIRKTIFDLRSPNTTALLINSGANVNAINNYRGKDRINLLMEVCSFTLVIGLGRKKFEFVQLLVENNANIHYKDSMGNTVLFKLVDTYRDSHHIDQYDDENGEMITETLPYPEFPSEKIMKYLIGKGADINARNNMGMTPLMHYSLRGNDRLVKILLDAGADINVKNTCKNR